MQIGFSVDGLCRDIKANAGDEICSKSRSITQTWFELISLSWFLVMAWQSKNTRDTPRFILNDDEENLLCVIVGIVVLHPCEICFWWVVLYPQIRQTPLSRILNWGYWIVFEFWNFYQFSNDLPLPSRKKCYLSYSFI